MAVARPSSLAAVHGGNLNGTEAGLNGCNSAVHALRKVPHARSISGPGTVARQASIENAFLARDLH
jgi:hypothetical protein